MAKVTQVTNDQERDAMQDRIVKAALYLSNPLLDEAEKSRLMQAYDSMVEIMKAYDRAELVKKYPGLREIYEQLGWVVGTGKVEQEPAAGPQPEEVPESKNYADWLE